FKYTTAENIVYFGGSARHSYTHIQGTRPEGLGGSRDAGPAVAGPRPPYVTEAERHNNVGGGYAVQRLRPYGPYGPNRVRIRIRIRIRIRVRIRNEIDSRIRVRAESSSYYNRNNSSIRTYLRPYRPYGRPTLAGSKDSPPTIRTVGYRDKLRRHEARRPKTKDTIDWLEKHAFFCRKVGPGPDESIEHSYGLFQALPKEIQGLGGSRDAGPAVAGPRPPYVTEAEAATPYSGYGRTGRTGRTRPEGLGGSRDAGPAVAGPRPPYVTEAERHNNVGGGYAVQRLRPYGPYGPYEGRNVG
ncbi:hypothetical protein L249_8131, partial [Ophiocordyceps polyrhachis-furcata BCC 54312]